MLDRPLNGPLNDCEQAKNRGKTVSKHVKNWLRQKMMWNLNIMAVLNDPHLPVRACHHRFQQFLKERALVEQGRAPAQQTAAKNLEEWDRT